jgi:hypothetical protein
MVSSEPVSPINYSKFSGGFLGLRMVAMENSLILRKLINIVQSLTGSV